MIKETYTLSTLRFSYDEKELEHVYDRLDLLICINSKLNELPDFDNLARFRADIIHHLLNVFSVPCEELKKISIFLKVDNLLLPSFEITYHHDDEIGESYIGLIKQTNLEVLYNSKIEACPSNLASYFSKED